MDFKFNTNITEIKETGKCANCGNETCYYDNSSNKYICSEECYVKLRKTNINRLEKVMDSISDSIDENFNRRVEFGKEIRSGIKFLFNCMMLLPREVKSYFKDKKNG